jgi:hypothetical protein
MKSQRPQAGPPLHCKFVSSTWVETKSPDITHTHTHTHTHNGIIRWAYLRDLCLQTLVHTITTNQFNVYKTPRSCDQLGSSKDNKTLIQLTCSRLLWMWVVVMNYHLAPICWNCMSLFRQRYLQHKLDHKLLIKANSMHSSQCNNI